MKKSVPFAGILLVISVHVLAQRTMDVDFNSTAGKLDKMFNECVGAF